MARSISVVAVVLLLAGVARGHPHGEVVSYYAEVYEQEIVLSSVPSGGFILTDVRCGGLGNGVFRLVQIVDGQEETKTAILGDALHSFRSGISFEGGSQIKFDLISGGVGPFSMTLSGYVPCPDPCGSSGAVPAVSTIGLGVMVVLVLAGGGFIFSRRQRQAA